MPCYAGENFDRSQTIHGVFVSRIRGHGPFGQSHGRGLFTQSHIYECQILNEKIVFRLFFEKGFKFAARLPPTFGGGNMITRNFLCPAQKKAQFALVITQRWIRIG